jgi:hypothetical protein
MERRRCPAPCAQSGRPAARGKPARGALPAQQEARSARQRFRREGGARVARNGGRGAGRDVTRPARGVLAIGD